MPPADGAIGSRCARCGTARRARRAIRWYAAVPLAWPVAASATAARIRHRSTGRRTRHPRPDVASLVSKPSHAPNMLMLGRIDSHPSRTFKLTFKTASQDEAKLLMPNTNFPHPEERPIGTRLEGRTAPVQLEGP